MIFHVHVLQMQGISQSDLVGGVCVWGGVNVEVIGDHLKLKNTINSAW